MHSTISSTHTPNSYKPKSKCVINSYSLWLSYKLDEIHLQFDQHASIFWCFVERFLNKVFQVNPCRVFVWRIYTGICNKNHRKKTIFLKVNRIFQSASYFCSVFLPTKYIQKIHLSFFYHFKSLRDCNVNFLFPFLSLKQLYCLLVSYFVMLRKNEVFKATVVCLETLGSCFMPMKKFCC